MDRLNDATDSYKKMNVSMSSTDRATKTEHDTQVPQDLSYIDLTVDHGEVVDLTNPENISSLNVVDLTMEYTEVYQSLLCGHQLPRRLPVHVDLTEECDSINTEKVEETFEEIGSSSKYSDKQPEFQFGLEQSESDVVVSIDLTTNEQSEDNKTEPSMEHSPLIEIQESGSSVAVSNDSTSPNRSETTPDLIEMDDTLNDPTVTVLHGTSTPMLEDETNDVNRLTEQLHQLHQQISNLEETEVDLDNEEDSNFIIAHEYRLQAYEIHEKINRIKQNTQCQSTAESFHFNQTPFTELNKKLEEMFNQKKETEFPSTVDVLKCIKFCNKSFNYRLTEDNFLGLVEKILLQFSQETRKQRKISLDEMFSYYTNNQTDPALNDCILLTKLEENKKLDCEYEPFEDDVNRFGFGVGNTL